MKYFQKAVGERVYLSPMSAEDAETYVRWCSDPAVSSGLGNASQVLTVEAEKKWIAENAQNYQFAIVEKGSDRLLGNCGFQHLNPTHRCAEAGLFIGEEKDRGKGLGAEALGLLIDYGFDVLNLHNIMLTVFSFNERAMACYRRVGFKEFGRRRRAHFVNGRYWDVVYMDLLREDRGSNQ